MPSKSESISMEVCADEDKVRFARSQAVRRRRRARALVDKSGDKQLAYEYVRAICQRGNDLSGKDANTVDTLFGAETLLRRKGGGLSSESSEARPD